MLSSIPMSSDIRVKTALKYKPVYNSLTKFVVGDSHELFFVCVCVGYKNDSRLPSKKKYDCFWSVTIKPEEWIVYYSICVRESDMDFSSLGNDQKVIELMQEYANGGMEFIIKEFLTDYLTKDSKGDYIVSHKEHLPKEFLQNLTDWSHQVG